MTIPIVFAVDDNVVMPCGVTITSLLLNAKLDTFYDIFILYNRFQLSETNKSDLQSAFLGNEKCRIVFVEMGDAYFDAAVLGRLTTAAYYRLAIPKVFPQFEKIIYSDVDIVFQQDLAELYHNSLPNKELIAAVLDLSIDDKYYFKSDLPFSVGKSVKDYFNSGFLVMNLKRMREENVVEEFNKHARIKYGQCDQDVLNVVCNGHVQILPSMYNFQLNHFANYMWRRENPEIQFNDLFKRATLHYVGKHKPWNSLECVAYDTWWHYYKMSPFYDDKVYFKRQYDQIEACRNDYHVAPPKKIIIHLLGRLKRFVLRNEKNGKK